MLRNRYTDVKKKLEKTNFKETWRDAIFVVLTLIGRVKCTIFRYSFRNQFELFRLSSHRRTHTNALIIHTHIYRNKKPPSKSHFARTYTTVYSRRTVNNILRNRTTLWAYVAQNVGIVHVIAIILSIMHAYTRGTLGISVYTTGPF